MLTSFRSSVGDLYIRVAVISEAVIKGEINIVKVWKNLGPQDLVHYMRATIISVDVTTGYYCTSLMSMFKLPLTILRKFSNLIIKCVWFEIRKLSVEEVKGLADSRDNVSVGSAMRRWTRIPWEKIGRIPWMMNNQTDKLDKERDNFDFVPW